MPGQSTQSAAQSDDKATAPVVQEQSAPAQDAQPSNSEQQEKLRSKKGTDTGLANYQAALGSWLGGELYQAIAPHLTFESMQKYANEGLSAALEGGVGALDNLEGEIDKKALANFGKALSAQYGDLAGKWLDTDTGKKLTGGLADWVDANPRLIVLIALLAAAGAVLADMDIPTIKQKFKIADGLTAQVEAKLGSLQNIALEEIKAQLSYESGPLMAAVQVVHKDEGGQTYKAEIGLSEKDSYNIKADVELTNDGIKAYGASGMLQTDAGKVEGGVKTEVDKDPVITGKLTRQDGEVTTVDEVKYDANTGVFTFKDTKTAPVGEDGKVSATTGVGSDGSNEVGVKAEQKLGEHLTGTAGFQHTTTAKDGALTDKETISGGLKYDDKDKLNASLDASLSSDGSGKVGGKAELKPSDHLKLGAYGEYNFGENSSYKLGGSLSYEDEKNKLMASGSYASEHNKLNLDLMGQRYLTDDFALRGSAGFQSSDNGNKYSAGLHGAYFFDKDVAGIAGGRYQLDEKGQSHFIPEVGAQIKGVPLTVGYDTQTKGWVVGATIRF